MPTLRDPRAGLTAPEGRRTLVNRSQDIAKVSIVVPAGATIEVDAVVAAQLLALGAFADLSDTIDNGPAGAASGGADATPDPEGIDDVPSGPAPTSRRRARR